MNVLKPDELTANERLSEIAEIPTVGLMRLRARQSSPLSPDPAESSVDCAAGQSGHLARKFNAVGVRLLLTGDGRR
jgi:hypothetical protein